MTHPDYPHSCAYCKDPLVDGQSIFLLDGEPVHATVYCAWGYARVNKRTFGRADAIPYTSWRRAQAAASATAALAASEREPWLRRLWYTLTESFTRGCGYH